LDGTSSPDGGVDDWLRGPSGLRLSVPRRRAFAGERELELTKTTFDVLALLLRRRREVVSTEDLVREVWGYSDVGRPGFARTAVYRLRKELKHYGLGDVIEAVRGVGFRIAEPDDGSGDIEPLDLRQALASAATALFIVSPDERVMWANQSAERLTGYTVDELRALESGSELAAGDDPTRYSEIWQRVRAGETMTGRAKTRAKDGSISESGASWRPVFGDDGELLYAIVEFWPEFSPAEIRRAV
jgi:two-component system response regulator MprA